MNRVIRKRLVNSVLMINSLILSVIIFNNQFSGEYGSTMDYDLIEKVENINQEYLEYKEEVKFRNIDTEIETISSITRNDILLRWLTIGGIVANVIDMFYKEGLNGRISL